MYLLMVIGDDGAVKDAMAFGQEPGPMAASDRVILIDRLTREEGAEILRFHRAMRASVNDAGNEVTLSPIEGGALQPFGGHANNQMTFPAHVLPEREWPPIQLVGVTPRQRKDTHGLRGPQGGDLVRPRGAVLLDTVRGDVAREEQKPGGGGGPKKPGSGKK